MQAILIGCGDSWEGITVSCGRGRVARRGQSRAELHEPSERRSDTSQRRLRRMILYAFSLILRRFWLNRRDIQTIRMGFIILGTDPN